MSVSRDLRARAQAMGQRDVSEQIAHEQHCYRVGGPVELHNGLCPECGWRHEPAWFAEISVPVVEFLKLFNELDAALAARDRLRVGLDAIRRAHASAGACLEACASWRADDCDCGYNDAADDVATFAAEVLAGERAP